jgi:hypothetical protein
MAYQVRLRLQEVVSAGDEIVHRLDLREILGRDEMVELLEDALEEAGFEREDDTTLARTDEDGVRTEVDLEDLEVRSSLELDRELSAQVSAVGDGETRASAKRDAEARARERAQAILESGGRDVQREASEKLEAGEEERLAELNEILQGVYAEALKRKAPRMGEVIEVSEGTGESGDYELVIKVEV